jgi:2-polyprenyl-6-hydroxyphenyl methylase/3-demethylubiquinone-9 3-methyltransferase
MAAMQQADPSATLDAAEIDRFARCAAEWWDANGKFRTLHQIGPARLTFLRDALVRHVGGPQQRRPKPLEGLTVLDIGCGGGLVCEPLARLGASVTGIDPAPDNVEAARRHAEDQRLAISYRAARVEDLASESRTFDAVVCLEVVEHVPDAGAFLKTCASLVQPGGLMLLSTINRTLKAYLLAIVGAEYVLRWLPRGTHDWNKFVRPSELAAAVRRAGAELHRLTGISYDPLRDSWGVSRDLKVNYMAMVSRERD